MAFKLVAKAAGVRGVFFTVAISTPIWPESHAAGGADRNSLAEVSWKGRNPGTVTFAGLLPVHMHFPVGTEPAHTASAPSLLARSITFCATFRPRSIPAK